MTFYYECSKASFLVMIWNVCLLWCNYSGPGVQVLFIGFIKEEIILPNEPRVLGVWSGLCLLPSGALIFSLSQLLCADAEVRDTRPSPLTCFALVV